MAKLVFGGGSAVMLQFPYANETKRLRAERAFTALGNPAQALELQRLGTDVYRYLAYRDLPKRWYQEPRWWRREKPLIERTFEGLDDIHLTTVDYRRLGKKQLLNRRGIRVVARPLNGPIVRAVGSTDGDIDIIFWRLDETAWRVFFAAIDLSPDDPYSNCPVGVSLMPKVSSDNNFLEPLNFA